MIKIEITQEEADMIIESLQQMQDQLMAKAISLDCIEGKVHFAKFSNGFDIKQG